MRPKVFQGDLEEASGNNNGCDRFLKIMKMGEANISKSLQEPHGWDNTSR